MTTYRTNCSKVNTPPARRAPLSIAAILGAILALSGCYTEQSTPQNPTPLDTSSLAVVQVGSAISIPIIPEDTSIEVIDEIYPNNRNPDHLPEVAIGQVLAFRTQVTLNGKSASLENDQACDTIGVPRTGIISVGATRGKGTSTATASIVEEGFLQICFPQNNEPGTVIVSSQG